VISGLQGGQTRIDTFTYTITDADGDTSTTTLTITINGVTPPPANAVPVAVNDSFTPVEDTSFNGTLTGNDTPSTTAATSGAKPPTRPTARWW
jgi:hypothetical protein